MSGDSQTADETPALPSIFEPPPIFGPGDRIDRYVIVTQVGAGGMGVVYSAQDPELDRRVALKLLRRGGDDPDNLRLLREAQALAQLTHPNVVAVYDVGRHHGQVWLAMEFVAGMTLRRWLADQDRRWPEILGVAIEICRGLVAAHAAGILHRDLKPDNIMIDAQHRVRVLDFGLARASQPGTHAPTPANTNFDHSLTAPSQILGTPGYMAPEQHLGLRLDARTDVYSLCVTLWEALHGTRPEPATNLPRSPTRRAPRWLERVCERGLAYAAEDRWPSAQALLSALELGQRRANLRRVLAVLAVLVALAVAAVAGNQVHTTHQQNTCIDNATAFASIWDPPARDRVSSALLGTGVANAPTVVEKLLPHLDAHAAALETEARDACLDHDVRGATDAATYTHVTACLGERRTALGLLLEELASGRAASLQAAVPAATALAKPSDCRNPAYLARLPLPPQDLRSEIATARTNLLRALILLDTDDLDGAELATTTAHTLAQTIDWPPLTAAVDELRGVLDVRQGRFPAAERTLIAAYFAAHTAGDVATATSVATRLISVVGVHRARPDDGELWARHAELGLRSLGELESILAARWAEAQGLVAYERSNYTEAIRHHEHALHLRRTHLGTDHPMVTTSQSNLANVHRQAGDLDTAMTLYQAALASAQQTLGPDHPSLADTISGLGNTELARGRIAAALAFYTQALELRTKVFGPDHPSLANLYNNLASIHATNNELPQALQRMQQALEIWQRTLGAEHPRVALALRNLAVLHRKLGQLDQTTARLNQARQIQEKTLGPDHPDLASTLGSLAVTAADRGDLDEAYSLHQRVLAIQEKALGPDHFDVGMTLHNLAITEKRRGDLKAAEGHYRRALTIVEAVRGPEHTSLADPLTNLAELLRTLRRHDEALALAQRALTVLQPTNTSSKHYAAALFVTAKIRWDANRDRKLARTLAAQARDIVQADPATTSMLAEIEAWLAAR